MRNINNLQVRLDMNSALTRSDHPLNSHKSHVDEGDCKIHRNIETPWLFFDYDCSNNAWSAQE